MLIGFVAKRTKLLSNSNSRKENCYDVTHTLFSPPQTAIFGCIAGKVRKASVKRTRST